MDNETELWKGVYNGESIYAVKDWFSNWNGRYVDITSWLFKITESHFKKPSYSNNPYVLSYTQSMASDDNCSILFSSNIWTDVYNSLFYTWEEAYTTIELKCLFEGFKTRFIFKQIELYEEANYIYVYDHVKGTRSSKIWHMLSELIMVPIPIKKYKSVEEYRREEYREKYNTTYQCHNVLFCFGKTLIVELWNPYNDPMTVQYTLKKPVIANDLKNILLHDRIILNRCQYCGGCFTLFKVCRNCGKKKDY